MISPEILDGLIRTLFVFVLISAVFIITRRYLPSLVSAYAVQSLLVAMIALSLFIENGSIILLSLAALTIASKVIMIPYVIGRIQSITKLKKDMDFHYLSPTSAIFAGIFIIIVSYALLSKVLKDLQLSSLFFIGSVIGISLTFMGMLVIFSRRQTITKIMGFLSMENGVLLMSLFLSELPFIIEVLIVLDLLIFILLATVLSFGIDSTMEEFHKRLNPFAKWLNRREGQE